MFQIIAGRSGSGKTEMIHRLISKQAGQKDIVLLVPEQSTFQNEKRILDDLGAKKASKVSVLSFKRLYDTVTEEYGISENKRIDDGVKIVLMSLAAEQMSDKLMLYSSRCKRSDFAELMASAVNEFKMCTVTPEMLYRTAEQTENVRLRRKLTECADVYSAYDALLCGAFSDPDDDMTRLYEILCTHDYFEGKTVFIDSFNGFSGQELKVLSCIIEQAEEITAALCCDKSTAKNVENSIFREPDMTLRLLSETAKKCGKEDIKVTWLEKQYRYKYPSLAAVEESVFRFDGDPYLTDDGAVSIYEADDEYDEIRQTARDISKLVRENGYSYGDITVILRDPEMYKSLINSEFTKYGIPFFMSDPSLLEEKPLIRLMLSAFEIVHSSFSTESILTYLKTDLTPLEPQDVYALENYVYIWDIKGVRWKSPFTMNPDGNKAEINAEKIEYIESLRQKVINPLVEFSERLSSSQNGGDISKAVFMLLQKLGTAQKMRLHVNRFSKPEEIKQKETEARVWDAAMMLLDKMYSVLCDKKLDSRRYLELFRIMIRKNPLSDIPQTLDHVTVGTAGTFRTQSQKAVFVIGALEGVFPAVPAASGLFSDSERTALIGMELPLYDPVYGASLKEKFNAYAALSMPSEKLYISSHRSNSKGERCEASLIVREVCAILGNINIRHSCDIPADERYLTPRQSFEELASVWREESSVSATLKEYFCNSPEYSYKLDAIERMVNESPYEISDRKRTRKLFGEKLSLSASQTETFYQCPFRYFCSYGLKAYPRKRASADPGMYGSAVHFILENLLRCEDFEELKSADEERLLELIKKYIAEYFKEIGGDEERTGRFMAQFGSVEKNTAILLKRLIEEFKVSSFVPVDFELGIGSSGPLPEYELTLPTGENISIVGKVDRVDTYVRNNEKYIRIVDYKTGTKKFRLSDIIYGLNIQMLLYLSIIEKNGKERYSENERYALAPAGILYMPSTPTAKTGEYRSEENIAESKKNQRSSFRMNGLLINDTEILSAMENGLKGIFIPAKLNSDGKLSGTDKNFADLETYGKIFSYIDSKLIGMAQSLYDGKIGRKPAKGSGNDACTYCDYKTVCGFEEGKPVRRIESMKNSAVFEIIAPKEETKNE